MSKKVLDMKVGELLAMYPNGFVISAMGTVEEILAASSHLNSIVRAHPLPPPDGGYLVVQAGKKHLEENNDNQTR